MSIKQVVLPDLGEGVTEGELVKWLVAVGETVTIDQSLAEIMTDKATMEVPSPEDGVIESLLAKEGENVQVGGALLSLKVKGTSSQVSEKQSQSKDIKEQTVVTSPQSESLKKKPETTDSMKLSSIDNTDEDSDVLATPFVRRLAKKLAVSINQIKGTGLSGRVTKEDILKYSGQTLNGKSTDIMSDKMQASIGFSVAVEKDQDRTPLKGVRKKIAEKMQLSKQVIPHFTLLESADVEQLEQMKNTAKEMLEEKDIKVTYLSFVMKALLETVKEFPLLNASIDDFSKEVVTKNYYHFGFAADTPRGLLVPVLKDVDKKSLSEISVEIKDLATKAREGKIQADEMSGGTITITNIGSLGGEYATPIINPPESAILGMYRMFVRAHWDGEKFIPRKTMNFSLTCDHRLIDGAVSARALKFFVEKIQSPLSLFL